MPPRTPDFPSLNPPPLAPLTASGPSRELGEAARDLDWLVGTWEGEVVDFPLDGPPRRSRGEWHFSWVLEGRALQDVWIVPPRRERGSDEDTDPQNRYGTTLRVYDSEAGQWRITWNNPVSGVETRLVGGRRGRDLVFLGEDAPGKLLRWSFTEIHPDRFLWKGEACRDDGATWRTEAEFRLRHVEPSVVATKSYSWRWTDRPGLESLTVRFDRERQDAEGAVLVILDGIPVEVTYRLTYDAAWRFVEGTITARVGTDRRSVSIARGPGGDWSIDGMPRPDLARCDDIDVMVTPFTNTPPLRRFALSEGEARSLRVAWVRLPDLSIAAAEQEYARIPSPAGTDRRYRYRNLDSGFRGELTVDDRDVVLEYGPWERRMPRDQRPLP